MVRKNFKRRIRKPILATLDPKWGSLQSRRVTLRARRRRLKQQSGRFGSSALRFVNPGSHENLRLVEVEDFREHFVFRASTAHYSFWMQRFFNLLSVGGKQKVSERFFTTALWGLGSELSEEPIMLVFEFFELFRYPVSAVQVQRGFSTTVRLTFLPWWRQYLLLLRWFMRALRTSSVKVGRAGLVAAELGFLFLEPQLSQTVKRRGLIVSLSIQSRLALNFRWKR